MPDKTWCADNLPCATATALREQLAEAREAFKAYAWHRLDCADWRAEHGNCDCGFTAALAKMEGK